MIVTLYLYFRYILIGVPILHILLTSYDELYITMYLYVLTKRTHLNYLIICFIRTMIFFKSNIFGKKLFYLTT